MIAILIESLLIIFHTLLTDLSNFFSCLECI